MVPAAAITFASGMVYIHKGWQQYRHGPQN
jgi:hypothetical protein